SLISRYWGHDFGGAVENGQLLPHDKGNGTSCRLPRSRPCYCRNCLPQCPVGFLVWPVFSIHGRPHACCGCWAASCSRTADAPSRLGFVPVASPARSARRTTPCGPPAATLSSWPI